MDFPAAPKPGRRVSFGAAAVLAGYLLLAAPLFVLAPFVLLTLLSRPRTGRELFWLVAAGVGLGLTFSGPRPLGVELLWASGLVLAAVFTFLSFRSSAPAFGRALLAVVITAVAIFLWEWSRGVSWPELQQSFTTMLREAYQAMSGAGGSGPAPKPEVQKLLQSFIDAAPDLARVLPGVLALEGLAGVLLAWDWHHRIAARPLGLRPGRFREFRFNDHLVWGAIFTLALLIAPVPDAIAVGAENLLILWVGLYAMRGLAVAATLFGPAPAPLRVLTAAVGILLFPLTLGVCLALGLADTWLDIRARVAPRAPGGI